MMTDTESIVFTIYLFLSIFGFQSAIVDIYEFVLFKDYGNTHRFKRKYQKRPFLKRFFLLSVFDNELIDGCKHKNILKGIFVADIVYWITGLIAIVSRVWLIVIDNNKYDLLYFIYSFILIAIYLWYLIHSVRGDEWVKGNWRAGQREFQILLPDERKQLKRNKTNKTNRKKQKPKSK